MKEISTSKVLRHVNTDYRYTFYPLFAGESGLIEIEVSYKNIWGNWKWKRIYMGHIDIIESGITFYESLTNKAKT